MDQPHSPTGRLGQKFHDLKVSAKEKIIHGAAGLSPRRLGAPSPKRGELEGGMFSPNRKFLDVGPSKSEDLLSPGRRSQGATPTPGSGFMSPKSGGMQSPTFWSRSIKLDEVLEQQEKEATGHTEDGMPTIRAASFKDEAFPAGYQSLYGDGRSGAGGPDWEWKRPGELGRDWLVMGRFIQPHDIVQGQLGNCWFLTALSVLADHPRLIRRILITRQFSAVGTYIVRFFHNGMWQLVTVDDLFPTNGSELVYGHCKDHQLWVPLIEKAYAKLHGCYANIVQGHLSHALSDLTGAPCETINLMRDGLDREALWVRLLSFRDLRFPMGATSRSAKGDAAHLPRLGLTNSHAYSLVDVQAEEGHRLVRLRNPWGRGQWAGEWGPASPVWRGDRRYRLPNSDGSDGMFWMPYEEFLRYFSLIDVCKEREQWYSVNMVSLFPDAATMVPQQMYEVRMPPATEFVASVVQHTKGGPPLKLNEFADAGLLVTLWRDDVQSQELVGRLWPTLAKVAQVELTSAAEETTYLLLPVSFLPRRAPLTYTVAMFSSKPLRVRPVPYDSGCLSYGLHSAIKAEAAGQQIYPFVFLYAFYRESAVFVLLSNEDRERSVLFSLDCSGSENLISSRRSLVAKDTLPPATRQLVMVLVQKPGTEFFSWKYKYHFDQPAGAPEAHDPPLASADDVHSLGPLQSPKRRGFGLRMRAR